MYERLVRARVEHCARDFLRHQFFMGKESVDEYACARSSLRINKKEKKVFWIYIETPRCSASLPRVQ